MLGGTVAKKRHRRVSYILREEEGRHRGGVNSLALNRRGELLFTAGRDGTARCWSTVSSRDRSERVYDDHTDWVNDVVLLGDEATLVTGSSDNTIKFWNVQTGQCVATYVEHTDYVKALAYARSRGLLASAGLDREVVLWDLEGSTQPVAAMGGRGAVGGFAAAPITSRRCSGHQDSVYCLAMDSAATVCVSGSTERVSTHAIGLLRMWDPRSGEKVGRLKGHTDNVRCVVINGDGTKCISGGSDATVKLWDLRQQKCLLTICVHTDSVWSLDADPGFTKVFSGGRDKAVFCTDLDTMDSTMICQTGDPVLSVLRAPDESLWLSTTAASVELWEVEPHLERERGRPRGKPSLHTVNTFQRRQSMWSHVGGLQDDGEEVQPLPLVKAPVAVLQGLPAVVKCDFLENRRNVLTKDAAGHCGLWDVTSGRQVKNYGEVDFDKTRKQLADELLVPAWCSIDCRLGSIMVNLDFPQAFTAEQYAVESGFPRVPELEETKINVGFRVLRSLFRSWRRGRARLRAAGQEVPGGWQPGYGDDAGGGGTDVDEGLDYQLADAVRVLVSEGAAHPPLVTKRVSDWDGREPMEVMPEWLAQSLDRGYACNDRGEHIAEPPKIGFYLSKDPAADLKQMQLGKLNAPQILRAQKVLVYAVSKLELEIPPGMPRTGNGSDEVVDYLQLHCGGRVVPLDMNLMTIRKFLAKGAEDLLFTYSWKGAAPPASLADRKLPSTSGYA